MCTIKRPRRAPSRPLPGLYVYIYIYIQEGRFRRACACTAPAFNIYEYMINGAAEARAFVFAPPKSTRSVLS